MCSSSFLSSLTALCAKHLLDEKIFIVPAYQIGHQIGEALAKAGHAWVNLRFVTLSSLALEMAGMELSAKGFRQISGTASRLLINRIFRGLKEDQELQYYGQLEAQSGIIDSISRSIADLRLAGISSEQLKPEHFIDKQKGLETQSILGEYEEELEKGKFFDRAALYSAATEMARNKLAKTERHFLCLENQIFSKVERDFLDALTDTLVYVPHGPAVGIDRPRRLTQIKPDEEKIPKPNTDLERAPWLFALTKAPNPFKDNTLQMFQALGPTNECREVIRRIIEEKIPFDEIEIVHPSGSAYPSIFYGLSEKTDLKFTASEGLPISFTIPGKVYAGIVAWVENEFPAKDFCALLESEHLKTPKGENDESLSPLRVSRILKEAKIGWGKERYVQRLEALYEEKKKKADEESKAELLKAIYRITKWFAEIFDLFPSREERIDLVELCAGISSFMKKYCRVKDERDGEALGAITARLDESASFKSLSFAKDEAIEWLTSVAENLCVGSSGPQSGSIHLSPYLSGGYSGRPYTFIVGLDQGAVPGSRLPDPILLDEEREAISKDLALSSDRLRENRYLMTALLSSLRGQAVLSFSAYDVIEQRLSFPSSFLLQVYRLLEGDAGLDYSALAAYLGSASGFVPPASVGLDETDWWLSFVAGDGEFKDALKSIKTIFPFIAQGDYAREKRLGPDLSSYDGVVTLGQGEFHPCFDAELKMSASRLETLADCPYRYFLRYVLDVKPPDEIVLDKAQWLDARQRGTLLHDIFCGFMRRLRERRENVAAEKHREEIREVAGEMIASLREENPPPSEAVFDREARDIVAALDIFLKAEEKRERKVVPLLFEVNFGFEGDEREGIGGSVVMDLGEGKSFRLAGRIDRVDALGSGFFRVIDYKTGSYTRYERIKSFGKGQVLQHALYAEAAERIIKALKIEALPRVSSSGYAFPTHRGEGREILIENFDRHRLRELLGVLFSVLERGKFLVNPKAVCDFCDYGAVCGKGVIDRTKDKMETNASDFAFFEKLEEFE